MAAETPALTATQIEFSKKTLDTLEWLLRSVYPAGLDPILQEVPSPEEEFQNLMKEFERRGDWSEIVTKYVQGIRKSQDPIPFENVIRIYGLQNARAFLIAYKLSETMPLKLLEKGKEGHSLAQPISSLIRFAPQTLIRFGEDSRYKQVAYASGLLFDLLFLKLADGAEGQGGIKKLSETLGVFHERACKDALFAIELARFRKKLPLEKHIVTLALVEAASRVTFSLAYPEFLPMWGAFEKAGMPESGRLLQERGKFGGEHWMMAPTLASLFRVLEEAIPAISSYALPGAQTDPKLVDSRDLASIFFVAQRLITKKNPTYDKEVFKAAAYRPEVSGFSLEIPMKELDPLIKKHA